MPSLHEEVCSNAEKLAREINDDVMAGEAEIAEAIQAGFDYIARRSDRRSKEILEWAFGTFGSIATYHDERLMRFLEEAVELVHAAGLPADAVSRITERVYSRPRGTLTREIGQAGMTLEALAANSGVSVDTEIEREFERVKSIPKEEWNKRHSAKVAIGIAS